MRIESVVAIGLAFALAFTASGCVSERVTDGPPTIVTTHGGQPIQELELEDAAKVLSMALGQGLPTAGARVDDAEPEQESWEDALELFDGEEADLDLPSTTLGEALRLLAEASSVNLVLADEFDEVVELNLHGVTTQDAMATLVRRFDLELERHGSVLVVGRPRSADVLGRVFPLNSVSATDLLEPLRNLLSEEGQVSASPSGNAVFVRDTPDNLREVATFLGVVDATEEQVAIEVRIYEIGFNDGFQLGFLLRSENIDFGEATGDITQNLLSGAQGFTAGVINDSGNLQALTDALESLTTIDLLSMPSVTALSGREAAIEIITRIPYVQATNSVTTDAGASTTTEEIQFEEVGIKLTVTPTVQSDAQIRLQVAPEISEAVDFVGGVPVVDSRKVSTSVLVGDGGTVYLGGLVRHNVFKTIDKVPVLGDIPYFGYLFRRTSHRHSKSQLIVELCPRLVRTADHAQRLEQRHREAAALRAEQQGEALLTPNIPD